MIADGMYYAKVVADSISPEGNRLTSMEVRYPHAVHKDILTHCIFERNFLSFRAWPPEKVFAMVEENGFVPEVFYGRDKGMNQGPPLTGSAEREARDIWLWMMAVTVAFAKRLNELGVDKGTINVLLQDFAWITGIISATEWDNFFALRAFAPEGSKPRPEIEKIARMMYEARKESKPRILRPDDCHLPYVDDDAHRWARAVAQNELELGISSDLYGVGEDCLKGISAGRTARISYLTHDGQNNPARDYDLFTSLLKNGHMSPMGHQATPLWNPEEYEMGKHGKFRGFKQFRKELANESNFKLVSGVEF